MKDITPKFFIMPFKEKVKVTDGAETFGQSYGGFMAGASSAQQGAGNEVYKASVKGIHLGAAEFEDAPFSVTMEGVLNATSGHFSGDITGASGTFSGTITAVLGSIGGFDIGADYIRDAANSMGLASTVTGADDVRFWAGDTFANRASAAFRVTEGGAITASNITITGGSMSGTPISSIPNSTATDISLLEKSHNLVFSVTDADTIAWTSGTIVLSNGRTFTISSGNTGNMSALTYIYIDTGVSSTVLQTTTTYSTAMGANKVLLGMAQNNTVTASFIPYGPGQPLIDGANIGALSIIAGNIAASTITGGKIAANTITAGNITALTITAAEIAASTITGAKIAANTITAGNIAALTITAAEIAATTITAGKLSISTLSAITADLGTITAGTITGALIRTAASGARVQMSSSDNRIEIFNASASLGWFGGAGANGNFIYVSQTDTNEDFPPIYVTSAQDSNVFNLFNTNTALSNRPGFRFESSNANSELMYLKQTGADRSSLVLENSGSVGTTQGSTLYLVQNGTDVIVGTNVAGCYLTKAGIWTDASSRTLKENFKRISVLEKIKGLDILEYNYIVDAKRSRAEIKDSLIIARKREKYATTDVGRKGSHDDEGYLDIPLTKSELAEVEKKVASEFSREQSRTVEKHFTPMAEDFNELFGLGNDKGMSPNDVAGIALQAIKELSERIELLEAQIK